MWAYTSRSPPWSINSLQNQVHVQLGHFTDDLNQNDSKNQYSNRHPLYLISSIQKVAWPKQLLYSAAWYRNIHLSLSDEQDTTPNWDDSVNNPQATLLICLQS